MQPQTPKLPERKGMREEEREGREKEREREREKDELSKLIL